MSRLVVLSGLVDDLEIRKWYILSATAGIKELENRFCALSSLWQAHGEEPIDYFLPTCVEQTSVFGQPAMRRKKLLGNYVFVRDTYARVLEIKSAIPSLWLLPHPDRGQDVRRFMTITDREMDVFKTIARAHANELPCYPIGAVDLDEGDKVEIVGGDLDGMCGTLQCSQGRNGGRVLMVIAAGSDLSDARRKVYAQVEQIQCDNLFYRKDIAHIAFE